MLLVMHSIFRTGEVGVIWPDHHVWAIILTPPFEPIDLKKMERCSFSLGLGLQYRPGHTQSHMYDLFLLGSF
jgi:hypothetical protein